MMLLKLGIVHQSIELILLVDELLALMTHLKLDYTNTFLALTDSAFDNHDVMNKPEFQIWLEKWKKMIESTTSFNQATEIMTENNPAFIPRNHLVKAALEEAVNGNYDLLTQLLTVPSKPHQYEEKFKDFSTPPSELFENRYAIFCGT